MVFAASVKTGDRHSYAIVRAKNPLRMSEEGDSTERTEARCRFRRVPQKVTAAQIRFHGCISPIRLLRTAGKRPPRAPLGNHHDV